MPESLPTRSGTSGTTVKRPGYPASLVIECRRMRDAGWTTGEIHRMLKARGQTPLPARATIDYWTDDRYADRQKRKNVERLAKNAAGREGGFRLRGKSAHYKREFVRTLRAEGVPPRSIAKVYRVVFGISINEKTVARMLKDPA